MRKLLPVALLALLLAGCFAPRAATLRPIERADAAQPERTSGTMTRSAVALSSMIALDRAFVAQQDGEIDAEALRQRRLQQEPATLAVRKDGNELLASQGLILLTEIDLALMGSEFGQTPTRHVRGDDPPLQLELEGIVTSSFDDRQVDGALEVQAKSFDEAQLDAPSLAIIARLDAELEAMEQRVLDRSTRTPATRNWTVRIPVDNPEITSPFGIRKDPINGKRRKHRGADYRGKKGDPVYAAGPGEVLLAGWGGRGTGNAIVVRHAGDVVTQYFHLSRVDVQAGDTVESGEKIGEIGSTGRATGPHLHFMFSKHGEAMDPVPWIGKTIEP